MGQKGVIDSGYHCGRCQGIQVRFQMQEENVGIKGSDWLALECFHIKNYATIL